MIFNEIDANKIEDITIGVFRMNKDYFNRIRKRDPKSDIYFQDYVQEGNTVVEDKYKREKALDELTKIVSKFIPKNNILVWN